MITVGDQAQKQPLRETLRDSKTIAGLANWTTVIGSLVVPSLLLIASGAIGLPFLAKNPAYWAVVLVTVLSVCVVLCALWILLIIRGAGERSASNVNPDLRVTELTRRCEVNTPADITYVRQYSVVARRQGVDSFTTRFSWTGVGDDNISVSNGCTYVSHGEPIEFSHRLKILFPRPLARGESFSFALTQKTLAKEKLQRPHYSVTITDQRRISKNSLEVWFDPALGIRKVWAERYRRRADEYPLWQQELNLDGDRTVRWEFKEQLYNVYVVRWAYA